jgi:hypothetical protein
MIVILSEAKDLGNIKWVHMRFFDANDLDDKRKKREKTP